MIDKDASARLRKEVQRLYLERTGKTRFSVLALSAWSGVNREPLRNYLLNGRFPDPDVLAKLASALGVTPEHLWLTWLGISAPQDDLKRIADALDRMAPLTEDPSGLAATAGSAVAEAKRLGPGPKPVAQRGRRASPGPPTRGSAAEPG